MGNSRTDSHLQRLWAPWRTAFLRGPRPRGCIFCRAKRQPRDDRKHLVIARGDAAFVLLNLYPYNNGHVMIAPYRHVGRLERLRPGEWRDMLQQLQRVLPNFTRHLRPHGYNLGMNLGRAGGAGVPGHLHLHLVPRWVGDVNFMPLLTDAKVISQSLAELYRLLKT